MNVLTKPEAGQTSFDDIKLGDMMAFTYWGKIEGINRRTGRQVVQVEDVDTGYKFNVIGLELVEEGQSADSYKTSETMKREDIATILSQSFNRPFTVKFYKKDGSARVLRGRLVSSEHMMGRSMVEDLDKDADLRQVDHRTIEYLIVNGVKYTSK